MVSSYEQLTNDARVQWFSQIGPFSVETGAGLVTGISANTWEDFYEMAANLTHNQQAGRIIGPELMTVADEPLAKTISFQYESEQRLEAIANLSRKLPHTEFVIGAPEYQRNTTFNSAWLIINGMRQIVARKSLITPAEASVFSGRSAAWRTTNQSTQTVICADLIMSPHPTTKHIQASCCWATPLIDNPHYIPPPDEERYTRAMKIALTSLMTHSAIHDIIVVDRTPSTTTIAPLNCFATRLNNNTAP